MTEEPKSDHGWPLLFTIKLSPEEYAKRIAKFKREIEDDRASLAARLWRIMEGQP